MLLRMVLGSSWEMCTFYMWKIQCVEIKDGFETELWVYFEEDDFLHTKSQSGILCIHVMLEVEEVCRLSRCMAGTLTAVSHHALIWILLDLEGCKRIVIVY